MYVCFSDTPVYELPFCNTFCSCKRYFIQDKGINLLLAHSHARARLHTQHTNMYVCMCVYIQYMCMYCYTIYKFNVHTHTHTFVCNIYSLFYFIILMWYSVLYHKLIKLAITEKLTNLVFQTFSKTDYDNYVLHTLYRTMVVWHEINIPNSIVKLSMYCMYTHSFLINK